jgi:hypothetical protein
MVVPSIAEMLEERVEKLEHRIRVLNLGLTYVCDQIGELVDIDPEAIRDAAIRKAETAMLKEVAENERVRS